MRLNLLTIPIGEISVTPVLFHLEIMDSVSSKSVSVVHCEGSLWKTGGVDRKMSNCGGDEGRVDGRNRGRSRGWGNVGN